MLKYTLRYVPLLILALLLVSLRIAEGNAQQANKAGLYPVSPPAGTSSALFSVAALPDGDAWAVGGSFGVTPATSGTAQGLVPSGGIILHYTNNTWLNVQVDGRLQLPLYSVSLDSPGDGWAVGEAGTLVHYDGFKWSTRPALANFKQNLFGVVMLSPRDGWAVGYSGAILHYNGKQWMLVSGPTTVDLHGVAFPSPDEGWAVGVGGTIVHYHNGSWSIVRLSPTASALKSVSMLSTTEGWAVGNQGTILHYRNGTWESVHSASYYQNPSSSQVVNFSGVAMNSIRSGWIVGGSRLLIYGSEAWIEPANIVEPSNALNNLNLSAIIMTSTGDGWAVGSIDGYNTMPHRPAGVILHYEAGKWNIALDLFFTHDPG